MPAPDWLDQARCAGRPLEVFFPTASAKETKNRAGTWTRARAVCNLCPVRAECLAWAMKLETSDNLRFGMYGGLTPKQRRRLHARGRA